MLVLLEQPDDISFTRNPVLIKLRALDDVDNLPFGPKGARSEMRRGFVPFGEDETLVLSWEEPNGSATSITFTFKLTPSAVDELPRDITPFIDYNAYFQNIGDAMMAHPLVGPFFRVYTTFNGGSQSLWIEALDTAAGWTVEFDSSGIASGSPSDFHYAAEASNIPDNYYVLVDIFVENTYDQGDYERVAILKGVPDADSNLHFNIEEVLDKHIFRLIALDSGLPIPRFTDNEVVKADVTRRYFFRYTEYSDDLAEPVVATSDIKLALCGGIAANLWAEYDFFTSIGIDNSLLTWYPDGKNVSTEQPEWLSWYNYTGEAKTIVLQLIRYTATETLPNLYAFDILEKVEAQDKEILLIPCGYEQLGIDDEDEVLKYTVRVVDADSDWEGGNPEYLSQARTFYVDIFYYEEKRYVQYLNGFCLPETLRCVGNFSSDLEVQRETTTRLLTEDYSSAFRELKQAAHDYDNIFTYRSGYLSKHEVDALQELLLYNHAWEVYEEGYIPLLIRSDRFALFTTRQYLHSVAFEAVPALRRRQYSNVTIPMTEEQAGWRTAADSFWKTTFGSPWQIAS